MSNETFVKETLEITRQVETRDLPMFFDYVVANIKDSTSFEDCETVLIFVTALKDVVMKQRKEALN